MNERIPAAAGAIGALLIVLLPWGGVLPGAHSEVPRLPGDYLTVDRPEELIVPRGGTAHVTILLEVRDGWHINSHRPNQERYSPTRVSLADTAPVTLGSVRYPPGESYRPEFVDETLSVYTGRRRVDLELEVPEDLPAGRVRVPLTVHFQPCSDTQCLRPMELTRDLTLRVEGSSDPDGTDWHSFPGLFGGGGGGVSASGIDTTFREHGSLLGWLLVFVLGLSLNLTPCVYPMIPVTVGYFGERQREHWGSRVLDALLYVLGMAIIYSILGALAGVTGSVLGAALQSSTVLLGVAGILVAMAGAMMGLYELRMPEGVLRGSRELAGGLGTFGMGMTLGLIAAPCLAPASVALLAYAGRTGSFLTGAGLFFVLSLGLGLPYLFLAVFTSRLASLPAAGPWTAWVKKIIGWLLVGTALYFLWPLLSDRTFGYLLVAWLVVGGAVLALVDLPSSQRAFLLRLGLLLAVVGAGVWGVGSGLLYADEGGIWEPGEELIDGAGARIPGPAVVYVAADWCLPCRRMEMTTFRDPTLLRTLESVRSIKVDITEPPSETIHVWLEDREVFGVPVMLFFDGTGREIRPLRAEGYVDAASLRERLDRLRDRTRRGRVSTGG